MRDHYVIEFKYTQSSFFCIWYTNLEGQDDKDSFVTDAGTPVFSEQAGDMIGYCDRKGLACDGSITSYDVDGMRRWVEDISQEVECEVVLNFWNISADFAYALSRSFSGDSHDLNHLYEKLFYGNNVPAINTSGELYIPDWADGEVSTIKRIMGEGIAYMDEVFLPDQQKKRLPARSHQRILLCQVDALPFYGRNLSRTFFRNMLDSCYLAIYSTAT